MVGRAPQLGVIDSVIQSFANAPVENPDGSTGITLHVQIDELNLPLASWLELDDNNFPVGAANTYDTRFGTAAERASGNAANIIGAKRLVFRYGVFANTFGGVSNSGIARGIPGDMFIVTLGALGNPGPSTEAGTFMHELGHTLGLRHGGDDDDNHKVDYVSVMNYRYQFPTTENQDVWRLDYDREGVVHPDWTKIIYIFRQVFSDLAGQPDLLTSFPAIDDPANPNSPTELQGDFNGDGSVSGRDFLNWQLTLNSSSQLSADANRNNTVDAGDLAIWKSSFGEDANSSVNVALAAISAAGDGAFPRARS